MRKMKVYTSAIKNLALLVVLGMVCQAMAQDAATTYTKMAPVEQYLMAERVAEIALARSAAPDSISRDAEVLVLGRHGFETAVKGKNGFVCIVGRGWTSAPDDDFPYGDWTAPYRTPEGFARVTAMYGETYDLLLGRRTYDLWSGFWPKAPKSPMADRLNAATKYVATHRPESLEWGPFEGIGPDLVESVRGIKAKDGSDLILSGSSTLTSALLEHGLADEVVLLVNPVLLGKGKRLFAEGTPPRAFALESTQALPSGIVINNFRAAGPLQNLR